MTHVSLAGGAAAPPVARFNRQALDAQIARRRMRLAELEAEMIAACEAAVAGKRASPNTVAGREYRGRTTWRRYLAAAMRLEATYGPRMRRLRREIGQIERLMTLLVAD